MKPRIHILATGGTIAGTSTNSVDTAYTAGKISLDTLLDSVPQIFDLADITGEQFCNIGSQDMNENIWMEMAKHVESLLSSDDYDGVLITHGTDTMEETAYFLNLTVHSHKPIILVGAMRSSTAISEDGPANIYNGVVAMCDPQSNSRGVMCCMNNHLISAKDVVKQHTTYLSAFEGGNSDSVGYVFGNKVFYQRNITSLHTFKSEFDISNITSLPKVGIVYGYAGCSPLPFKAFIEENYDGIVLAGVGNGNFYSEVLPFAVQAVKQGITVVRSTRCPSGPTSPNTEVDDDKFGFIASFNLNPQKSRILLMLALCITHDRQTIQDYFLKY